MFIEILLISLNVMSIEFKKVVKYDFVIKIFILIFLVSMSFMGLAKSNFVVTRDGGYIRDFIRILGRKRILKVNEKNGIYL